MLNDRCANLESIEVHTKVASKDEDAGVSNGQRRDGGEGGGEASGSQSRTPSEERRKFREELSESYKFTFDIQEYSPLHCRYIR